MAGRAAMRIRGALAALCFTVLALPLQAAGLLRDADIERGLHEIATPLIKAAGLNPSQIKLLVVDDDQLNAFVIDSRHILIHSGLILKAQRAEELQAVIAHELGHIANGHLARRMTNLSNANTAARFGMLLALAVGAASGSGEAAAGVAIGTQSSAARVFMRHTRAEESSADQTALRTMIAAGIDPRAMADVLEYFRGQEILSNARQDPYVRTHPLTRDRIRAVEGLATAYGNRAAEHPSAQYWFLRAQGKLSAFTRNPGWTLRRIGKDDTELATMRRAIAEHRSSDKAGAIRAMNRLMALRPGDPYYLELLGQIQLESRDFAGATRTYAAAANAAPSEPLILAGYGRALVATGSAGALREAVAVLERAHTRDATDPRLLRDLAVAYAKTGKPGMASVVTAERYAILGNLKTAVVHAKRAEGLLPRGSPGWNRALDVLSAAKIAGIEEG